MTMIKTASTAALMRAAALLPLLALTACAGSQRFSGPVMNQPSYSQPLPSAPPVSSAPITSEPLPPPLLYGAPGTEDYGMILNLEDRSQAMNDEEIWNNFEQLSMLDYYRAAFDETPSEIEPRAITAMLTRLSSGPSPIFPGSGET